MTSIGTYWRTVRHLKIRQIAGRASFRLGARKPSERRAPFLRDSVDKWVLPARRRQILIAPERFRLLNRERALDEGGWDPPDEEKLWRYNLHYFDDLNAFNAEERRGWHVALIERWIIENPPVEGVGWEPYPTSLRIVNWVKWALGGGPLQPAAIESLAVQARWLMRRVEWHLLGNHLFANAKALFFAGLFFRGPEADRWRNRAISIFRRQLDEQILGDGGQFELTPMYHLLAFEDVLDLLACIRCFGAQDRNVAWLDDQLRSKGTRMWAWAQTMRYRDGSLPRFNDCSEGVSPALHELARVANALALVSPAEPGVPVLHLAESGYVRLDWSGAMAFLDVARIGPDYLPGHAHADSLSFELAIGDDQIVVNRGTSCYGLSVRRHYERSTAAHSTVEVFNQSSSEMWSGFRVGRRAQPSGLRVTQSSVTCSHDGYRFLPGSPRHERCWTMLDHGLRIDDSVSGGLDAIARYHLNLDVHASEISPGTWSIRRADREVARVAFRAAWVRKVTGEQAVEFGSLVPAQTLEIGLKGGQASACWSW